jgi:hypothetical protein
LGGRGWAAVRPGRPGLRTNAGRLGADEREALKDSGWTTVLRTNDDSLRDETGEATGNLRQYDRKLVVQGLMTLDEFNQVVLLAGR